MTPVADEHVWTTIQAEAGRDAVAEPALSLYLNAAVIKRKSIAESVAWILAEKLGNSIVPADALRDLLSEAFESDPGIPAAILADLQAVATRDPACRGYSSPILYFKGFHAIQAYRAAHWFWGQDRQTLAQYLQGRISEVFAVDIHPEARIGRGIMFDHATSVVIGATAVIDDDFSMLHEVTLGGTGKVGGDRHPKIRRGVMIGAGAKVLGNIVVGEGAKIGAGSVVLNDVAAHTTVAGIPAKPVSFPAHAFPALEMDQSFESLDVIVSSLTDRHRD